MNSQKNKRFLTRIFEESLSSENPPHVQIAFAIAICTSLLNPKCERLQLNEKNMKRKVAYLLVSFCNFVNCDIFHYSNYLFINFRINYKITNQLDLMMILKKRKMIVMKTINMVKIRTNINKDSKATIVYIALNIRPTYL